jgi:hypothetical protein
VNVHADGMAYSLLNATESFEILIHIHILRLRGRSFMFVSSPRRRMPWCAVHSLSVTVATSSPSPSAMRMRRHRERMKLGAVLVAREPSV